MNIDLILKTINSVNYEGVENVEVPTEHLVKLRTEIVKLNKELATANAAHRRAVSEGIMILAAEHMTPKFIDYA